MAHAHKNDLFWPFIVATTGNTPDETERTSTAG